MQSTTLLLQSKDLACKSGKAHRQLYLSPNHEGPRLGSGIQSASLLRLPARWRLAMLMRRMCQRFEADLLPPHRAGVVPGAPQRAAEAVGAGAAAVRAGVLWQGHRLLAAAHAAAVPAAPAAPPAARP